MRGFDDLRKWEFIIKLMIALLSTEYWKYLKVLFCTHNSPHHSVPTRGFRDVMSLDGIMNSREWYENKPIVPQYAFREEANEDVIGSGIIRIRNNTFLCMLQVNSSFKKKKKR